MTTIKLSNEEMKAHGCAVCFWKANSQCPLGFRTDMTNATTSQGFCEEYINYILSFAGPDDSVSAMWEKFNTDIALIQSHADYFQFKKLENEIIAMELRGVKGEEINQLQMKKNAAKLWWSRISDSVSKSLAKITDREVKQDININIAPKISLQQLHQIANRPIKSIDSKGDK